MLLPQKCILPTKRQSSHVLPLIPSHYQHLHGGIRTRSTIHTAPLPQDLWLRYVDDTFVVWPHGHDDLENYFSDSSQLSTPQHPVHQGSGSRGDTPVPKCLCEKRCPLQIFHSQSLQEIHPHRQIQCTLTHTTLTSHPPQVKTGIVWTLLHWAQCICSSEATCREESLHLKQTFRHNGYPTNFIHRAFKLKHKPTQEDTDKTINRVSIPYTSESWVRLPNESWSRQTSMSRSELEQHSDPYWQTSDRNESQRKPKALHAEGETK